MKETLEQAVKRIAEELTRSEDGIVYGSVERRKFSAREAALRKMAAFQRERDAEIAEGMIGATRREIAAAIRRGE